MVKKDSIFVTDYDGVIKRKGRVNEFRSNVELLQELTYYRYTLMLSSGRLFDSMFSEIQKHNIPFDYLSCANGNALFDNRFQTIWKTTFDPRLLKILKLYYKFILSITLQDEYGEPSFSNAVEAVICIQENKEVRRCIVDLLFASGSVDYCTDGEDKYKIHIFKSSNKVDTIEIVRELLDVDAADVYAVGDGPNDLAMIRKYNGIIIGEAMQSQGTSNTQKYGAFKPLVYDIKKGLIGKKK